MLPLILETSHTRVETLLPLGSLRRNPLILGLFETLFAIWKYICLNSAFYIQLIGPHRTGSQTSSPSFTRQFGTWFKARAELKSLFIIFFKGE